MQLKFLDKNIDTYICMYTNIFITHLIDMIKINVTIIVRFWSPDNIIKNY